MTPEITLATELIDFIYNSPSPYHVVSNISNTLVSNGFEELKLTDKWKIEKGKKYFTIKNGSAIFAFNTGNNDLPASGIKMISAHSDSPGFKIKPNPEMLVENKLLKLNTEVYGGPILMSWLDRPLSIAGRVSLKSANPLFPDHKYIDFKKPILIIPNLAIHLNRSVNDGVALNRQKDMLPLMGVINDTFEKENYLLKLLADKLEVNPQDIIDFDLTLYEYEKGCIMGINDEFISSPKLDDLAMVHAGLKALINSTNNTNTQMLCIFDNEEVGSQTKQGAGSPVLANILKRVNFGLGYDEDDLYRMIYNSFMISADMAHSIHPNQTEKHDPVLHPVMNGGPVIKIHANQKYTTDGDSGAVFETICQTANVPYQKFVNRSDMEGGSTLGNVSLSQIDLRSVDIGNPMLAMHSVRELAGVKDHLYVTRAFETFYDI
ncbi:M18 family aminopeptidase [Plebeiibacterium sediminum]|uniref:M18 family aminopeptidase n=1 Tax=Plebeiibacterium sediminum TaxID=2992112 RepID=A0AAE3M681_9BACT|nr:M18 family aminopeptidase [Plebeiobacterium sediminum]MCW3787595.1 M18 family aminopeptidase [Plebeiobacterium sediminum]